MTLTYYIQKKCLNAKRLEWKIYICNKTKYAGNDGINITLMLRNFLIKNH